MRRPWLGRHGSLQPGSLVNARRDRCKATAGRMEQKLNLRAFDFHYTSRARDTRATWTEP